MVDSERQCRPGPGEADATAAAVATGIDGEGLTARSRSTFEAELVLALRKTPFWALSLLSHAGLYLVLYHVVAYQGSIRAAPVAIMLSSVERQEEEPLDQEWEFEFEPHPAPDPRPELEDDFAPREESEQVLAPGGDRDFAFEAGRERGVGFDPGDLTGLGFGEEMWRTDFGNYLLNLRHQGLDVVFLFDSTSSMWSVIDSVKEQIVWMISVLHTLIPEFRLGIATYRDAQDAYVVRGEKLSNERFRLMAYLHTIVAAGGGDPEEAVLDGLRFCKSQMNWASKSRRVIILIGDAPPHPKDVRRTLDTSRAFRRAGGMLHSIITFDPDKAAGRRIEEEAVSVFRDVARNGGGQFVSLKSTPDVVGELLVLSFGQEWRDQILRAYERYLNGGTWRDRLIKRRIESGELGFLVRRLRSTPVYAGLVQALSEAKDRSIVPAVRAVAEDPDLPSENRWAAALVLARLTGQSPMLRSASVDGRASPPRGGIRTR